MKPKGITTRISRCLVNHIKLYGHTTIPLFKIQDGSAFVLAQFVNRSAFFEEQGVAHAAYNTLSQTIKLDIVVPIEIADDWFSEFIPELKRSLRHELEHHYQHKRAGLLESELTPYMILDGAIKGPLEQGPWTGVGAAARYLLNPVEIEAHVVGIKFEAQARRTKFQVVFKEILNRIKFNLQDAGFEEKRVGLLIRRLYQVWGFYALARYPSLRKRHHGQKNKLSAQKEFDFPRDE
jgi:hypothetical protein